MYELDVRRAARRKGFRVKYSNGLGLWLLIEVSTDTVIRRCENVEELMSHE